MKPLRLSIATLERSLARTRARDDDYYIYFADTNSAHLSNPSVRCVQSNETATNQGILLDPERLVENEGRYKRHDGRNNGVTRQIWRDQVEFVNTIKIRDETYRVHITPL